MRVRFEHPRKGTLEGIITFMLPAGQMFTHEQMLKYAGIDVDHPHYAPLRNAKRCDRYVMEYRPGAYMIMPKGVFTEIPADRELAKSPAIGAPYDMADVIRESKKIFRVHDEITIHEDSEKSCTCGISAIGGGKHSDWCDL